MTTIKDTLQNSLAQKILENPEFIEFCKKPLPEYITENLAENKKPRIYQELAIKAFIFYWEKGEKNLAKHFLFHMATGTGKTLVMACCILFLYTRWYRKFVFFVSSVQIMDQAKKWFTKRNFKKYLFAQGISLPDENNETQNILIKEARNNFSKHLWKNIEIYFDTIQWLSLKINEPRENSMTEEDFEKDKIVLLADEAHHLNSLTKAKETEERVTWEGTIEKIFKKNPENILLEFTATVEWKKKEISEKYLDKMIFAYDFMQFREDGYCKQIQFLNSPKTHSIDEIMRKDGIEPQTRRMIINALVMSEYRKIIFEKAIHKKINPLILFKSTTKEASKKDFDNVVKVVENLKESDLDYLKNLSYTNDAYGVIHGMFAYLEAIHISLQEFVSRIRSAFRSENMIVYNSSEKTTGNSNKTKQTMEKFVTNSLANLDDENSKIRAVFIVQALREGWDVLSLFDLVHFDLNAEKKVESADIQLVGRGARYFPFVLNEEEKQDEAQTGLFAPQNNDPYKRKFDGADTSVNNFVLLESFYYHFIDEWNFFYKLQKELMLEGIIGDKNNERTLFLKESFKNTETYKKGFVLLNSLEKRKKPKLSHEEELIFHKTLTIRNFEMRFRALSDYENNLDMAGLHAGKFQLTEEYWFNFWLLKAALYYYPNKFFRLSNLQKHILELQSVEDFIKNFLSKQKFEYQYDDTKIENRTKTEKMNVLRYSILPMIERLIDTEIPKYVGSKIFRPRSIARVFQDKKSLFVQPNDERALSQNTHVSHKVDLMKARWYSHNDNFWTLDEKKFVKFFESKIADLQRKYPNSEIILMRNELDFFLYSPKNGQKFSPDFVLFISDFENKTLYYQCLFEVKWGHLTQKDKWKEEILHNLETLSDIRFEAHSENKEYQAYLQKISEYQFQVMKNIGFWFYTANTSKNAENSEYQFLQEFEEKLLS